MSFFTSSDAKKAEQITKTILENLKKLGNQVYNLKTEFQDGVVTLSGVCDSEATKKKVILTAQIVEGVKQVVSDPLILSDAAIKTQTPSAAPVAPAAPATPIPEIPANQPPVPTASPTVAPQPTPASVQASADRSVAPPASTASPTVMPPAPAQPQAADQMYTIQAGDTLSKIAKHFYGNANKYMVIFEANRDVLKDPDRIFPGQQIRIPSLT